MSTAGSLVQAVQNLRGSCNSPEQLNGLTRRGKQKQMLNGAEGRAGEGERRLQPGLREVLRPGVRTRSSFGSIPTLKGKGSVKTGLRETCCKEKSARQRCQNIFCFTFCTPALAWVYPPSCLAKRSNPKAITPREVRWRDCTRHWQGAGHKGERGW